MSERIKVKFVKMANWVSEQGSCSSPVVVEETDWVECTKEQAKKLESEMRMKGFFMIKFYDGLQKKLDEIRGVL